MKWKSSWLQPQINLFFNNSKPSTFELGGASLIYKKIVVALQRIKDSHILAISKF